MSLISPTNNKEDIFIRGNVVFLINPNGAPFYRSDCPSENRKEKNS